MNKKTAEFIVQIVENIGEEAELCEEYSGRGMYGKSVCGVVVDSEHHLIRALCDYIASGAGQDLTVEDEEIFFDLADGYRTDSMGLQKILY